MAIYARFSERLITLAAGRLRGVFRQKIDPEDLVQSAFKSFFRLHAGGTLEMEGWSDLWSLLVTITLRKFGYQVRQFLTAKRHVCQEGPLDHGDGPAASVALSREPSPAEVVMLGDLVERFLSGLSDKGREIAELALAGHRIADIAPRVGLTERSVFRQLARIRAYLAELTAD